MAAVIFKKSESNSARFQKTPFENDCGQKNPIQAVQVTKGRLLKMTVAKKTEPNSVRCKMAPCKNDCAKKNHPSSASYKIAPFKNDCGQKNPIQAVQDATWHVLKMIAAKKPNQTV